MIISPLIFHNKGWFASLFTVVNKSSDTITGVITHLYKGFRSSIILGLIKSSKILQNTSLFSICINGVLDLLWYHCILGMGDKSDHATGGLLSVLKNIFVPKLDFTTERTGATATSTSTAMGGVGVGVGVGAGTTVGAGAGAGAVILGTSPSTTSFAMHNGLLGLCSYSVLTVMQIIPGYIVFNISK